MSQEPDPTADFPEIATEAATPDQQQKAVDRSLKSESLEEIPLIPGYSLRHLLGAGTFGQVWAGVQDRTGLEVAVKIFSRESGLDWLYFRHEVERLRRVSEHPFVVTLLDADLTHEPPYFVMPLLPDSLAHYCRAHGRPERKLAARWLEEMAQALHFTHGKGLLHCDLKPNNIMVDQEGRVRVADFGQSMSRGASGETALGTLGTMAPEQAQLAAEGVPDVSWDVYGLGATTYWLLTGELPRLTREELNRLNELKDPRERLQGYRERLGEIPLRPVRALNPDIDPDLADIVQGCLQADPARRTRSVADVLEDLRRRRRRQPLLCRQPWSASYRISRFLRRHALPVALGAVLVVGLAWSFASVVSSRNQAVAANQRSQELLSHLEYDQAVALAEGGQQQQAALWFARAATRRPEDPTYLLPLRDWPVRLVDFQHLGDSIQANFELFGPHQVVWRRHLNLTVLDNGEHPMGPALELDSEAPPLLALSPDGSRLAVGTYDYGQVSAQFVLYDVSRGSPVVGPLELESNVESMQFSANGRRLLVLGNSRATLLDTGTGRKLYEHSCAPGASAISPDGSLVAFSNGPRVVLGGPEQEERELDLSDPAALAFAGGGNRLFSVTRRGRVEAWDVKSGIASTHTVECDHTALRAVLSPDGNVMLVLGTDRATLINLDGGTKIAELPCGHQLSATRYRPGCDFSPDSSLLVLSQPTLERNGQSVDSVQLYRTSDGEKVGVPTSFFEPLLDVGFAQDGKRIFVSIGGGLKCYDLSHLLQNQPRRTLEGAVGTHEAPGFVDNRLAVCQQLGTVRVYDLATDKQIASWKSDAELTRCLVSPDGHTLLPQYAGASATRLLDLNGKPVGRAVQCDKPIVNLAFAPDGKQFLTTSEDGTVRFWTLEGEAVGAPLQLEDAVQSARWDPSGHFVGTVGSNRQIKVWDVASRKPLVEAAGSVFAFATINGQTRFALASNLLSREGERPTIKTFSLPEAKPVGPPIVMMSLQVMLLFRPDNGQLLIPNMTGSVRFWNPATADPVGPEMNCERLYWAALDEPGNWLATSSAAAMAARLYDIRSGRPLTRQDQFQMPTDPVTLYRIPRFTPDRQQLLMLVEGSRGPARLQVWDLTVDADRSPEILTLEAETWTGQRLEPQGGLVPLTEAEWRQGRERLQALMAEHARVCKFPQKD